MNEKHKILLKTIPFLVIGLLVFVLYLVFFVNIPEMVSVIQRTNILIYSLAVLALILGTLFFTLSWQHLLLPLSVEVPLKNAFMYVWVGVFADLLIPAESVSGEIAKTYLMSKESNVNSGKVIASLVSQRMLGTIITTATLFIGFIALLILNSSLSGLMSSILLSMTILSMVGFTFLLTISVKEKWTERLINAIMRFVERVSRGRFKFEQFQTRIVDALRVFHESLRTFGSKPSKLVLPILFYVLAWVSSIALVFLVFISVGYLEQDVPIFLLKVIVVYILVVAIKSVPIGVPAEVALPGIIMARFFILFDIPENISNAVAVLTMVLTVWLSFFIGFVAVQWLGVKILMESGVFGKTKNKI